jgi:hypothetical protein
MYRKNTRCFFIMAITSGVGRIVIKPVKDTFCFRTIGQIAKLSGVRRDNSGFFFYKKLMFRFRESIKP